MAQQEKKLVKISDSEALAKAMQYLKGKPLPADTESFLGNLPSKMPDRFKKK